MCKHSRSSSSVSASLIESRPDPFHQSPRIQGDGMDAIAPQGSRVQLTGANARGQTVTIDRGQNVNIGAMREMGWNQNCFSCAEATEARLYGLPVTAIHPAVYTDTMAWARSAREAISSGRFFPSSAYRNPDQATDAALLSLEKEPDGTVVRILDSGRSHTTTLYKKNGKMYAYDAYSGLHVEYTAEDIRNRNLRNYYDAQKAARLTLTFDPRRQRYSGFVVIRPSKKRFDYLISSPNIRVR